MNITCIKHNVNWAHAVFPVKLNKCTSYFDPVRKEQITGIFILLRVI